MVIKLCNLNFFVHNLFFQGLSKNLGFFNRFFEGLGAATCGSQRKNLRLGTTVSGSQPLIKFGIKIQRFFNMLLKKGIAQKNLKCTALLPHMFSTPLVMGVITVFGGGWMFN